MRHQKYVLLSCDIAALNFSFTSVDLFIVQLGIKLISCILVFVMLGCSKEQQSRAASEGGRVQVSSILREEVFTERLIIF
jgi:uncharacterized membrane protein